MRWLERIATGRVHQLRGLAQIRRGLVGSQQPCVLLAERDGVQLLQPRVPIGFHVTFRLEDDRPFATTLLALRVIARVVLTQGERRGLLAFGTADDHLHALLAADRRLAGEFSRYVATALRALLGIGVGFEAARIRTLQDQRHAYNTFHYVHRQDTRHALGHDPLREGTSLPDLLGLRVLSTTLASRVRESLPRIRRADLTTAYPSMATDDSSTPVDVGVLADAAAAAFALTDLRGRSAELARARHAAVHVMDPSTSSARIGDCLGIGARAVRVLRSTPADPLVVRAIRGQALLRMAGTPPLAEEPDGNLAKPTALISAPASSFI